MPRKAVSDEQGVPSSGSRQNRRGQPWLDRLKSSLSRMNDAVLVIDPAMEILYQNPVAEAMGTFTGTACFESICSMPDACPDCPAAMAFGDGLASVLETGDPYVNNKQCTRNSRLEIAVNPVIGGDGAVKACIVIMRDSEVDRDMNKDALLMLSHDLRSPLMVIHGIAGLLRERGNGQDPELDRMLAMIIRSSERATQLVDDFATLSTIDEGKLKAAARPVSLRLLSEFHAEEYRVIAQEKGVGVHVEIPEDLPFALLDEGHSSRMLSNLLSNAIKYGRPGGNVWVRAGAHPGGRLFVEVSDDGPGIPEDELPRVFDRYYRCKHSGDARGTGLGLSIVKALAKLQGASVEAESRPGEGTTIRLLVPAAGS